MDTKTLRSKTAKGLQKELEDAHARLQELSFKTSVNQVKNVREMREIKRTIARIQTLQKQNSQSTTEETNSNE